MTITSYHKQYLQYIVNTGGNVTREGFDDDWEPIGPQLRADLVPQYIAENADRTLYLTKDGHAALNRL